MSRNNSITGPVSEETNPLPGNNREVKTKIKVVYSMTGPDGFSERLEEVFKNLSELEKWSEEMKEGARAVGGPVGNRASFEILKVVEIPIDEPNDIRENRKERIDALSKDIAVLSLYSNDHELERLLGMLKNKVEAVESILKVREVSE